MKTYMVEFVGGPVCGAVQPIPVGEKPPKRWWIARPTSAGLAAIRGLSIPLDTPTSVKGWYEFAPKEEGGDGRYHWQGWEKKEERTNEGVSKL